MSSSHLENIAIVGAGGQIGGVITKALLEQGKHKVTAITRPDSSSTMPSGLTAIHKANYENHNELVEALRGQDVLIITMGVFAAPGSQNKLIDAAADAGVKYVIPSEWDMDDGHEQMGKDVFLGPQKLAVRKYIESKGNVHWIGVACGFWYEFSMAGTEERFGFDFGKREMTFYDEGTTKITTTTWPQIGRALAKLLALPQKANNEPNVADWADKTLCIGSFYVSQRDMFESALRVTGTSEKDWTIKHEASQARYQRGAQKVQAGDFSGFNLLLYARIFYPEDAGEFESQKVNRILGLPEENLDEATAVAVKMAEVNKDNAGPTLKT